MNLNVWVLILSILCLVYAPIELTRLIIYYYTHIDSSWIFLVELVFIWTTFPVAIGLMIWQYFER